MSKDSVIPFWGPREMDLFARMARAIDPEGLIPAAMAAVAPIDGRVLLDVGAGVGDRTIRYAEQAAYVYALEPDPEALPILRGRVKSAGTGNVTVVPAGAAATTLPDGCIDVAYATWSYFFGPGSEPGLAEVLRVLRPGGDLVVVQNYGQDELSRFWASFENGCQNWPPWFAEHGFTWQVIDTVWRFSSPEEALAVLEFLWGERARVYVLEHDKAEFGYRVAVYHQQVPTPNDTGGLVD